jgi:hypothetical protein
MLGCSFSIWGPDGSLVSPRRWQGGVRATLSLRCSRPLESGASLVGPWYVRMADIPGIQFAGSPGVDRASLPEVRVRPRTESGFVLWPSPQGETSASPAHRRAFADLTPMSRDELVRWVWEGLELPGEPSDYHFLLQGAVERLWSRRRDDPDGLLLVETFAYLDLAL